jgi:hypothetical protein
VLKPRTGNNYCESMSIQTQSTDAQPICYINSLTFTNNQDNDCPPRCNLDSHANTCVARGNALEISHEDRRNVTVSGFSNEFEPRQDIHVSSVTFSLGRPQKWQTIHFDHTQSTSFWEQTQPHSLFNPNQLRDNGITIDDVPWQFDRTSTHSIYIPEHELRIPLSLDGIISGFECRPGRNTKTTRRSS